MKPTRPHHSLAALATAVAVLALSHGCADEPGSKKTTTKTTVDTPTEKTTTTETHEKKTTIDR